MISPGVGVAENWQYADVADLVLGAPVIATGTVVEAIVVPDSGQVSRPPNMIRYYLVIAIDGLIRGPAGGLAPRVSLLADIPSGARGRPPRLRKSKILLAAQPVADRPGELRLVARDALQPWSAAFEARVRAVAAAALAPNAPPQIVGVQSAFHVAGTLEGEGETQIFLATATGQPVSLSVLRRPGIAPSWSVALGEIVDEASGPPQPGTLLWYRLACSLPRALPMAAVGELTSDDAAAAQRDFALIRTALGPCARTRG